MHLGDSSLVIEVEKDYTVYGDELKFGGGKVWNNILGHLTCSLLLQNDDVDCAYMVNIFFPSVVGYIQLYGILGGGGGGAYLYMEGQVGML